MSGGGRVLVGNISSSTHSRCLSEFTRRKGGKGDVEGMSEKK